MQNTNQNSAIYRTKWQQDNLERLISKDSDQMEEDTQNLDLRQKQRDRV